MMERRTFMAFAAAATAASQASAASDADNVFHVAIFRFAKDSIDP
jgi:hypothetical protein